MANCGLFNGEGIDTSLLFFFLLLVIIFCNCYNQESEHIKEEKKVAGSSPATFAYSDMMHYFDTILKFLLLVLTKV